MKYKRIIMFSYILIIIIFLGMCGITYSYFNVEINGVSNDIKLSTLSGDFKIEYLDTSNVSMVNAYTGDKIIKNFTIENTGSVDLYFDISFENVVNNFEDTSDLVYRLYSNDNIYVKDKEIPIKDENILTDIHIKSKEKIEYILEVEFLKKDEDQSINMNKTFSSNLKISSSKNILIGKTIYEENTLGKIMEDSLLGIENLNEYVDGVYFTNSSIDGKTIYFYRGSNNLNNNVLIGNSCYKIIRTTSDYGIRLIYNGELNNNKCDGTNSSINTFQFNKESGYNTHVGYMYGEVNSSNYENEHNNTKSSDIKILLDSWYETNLKQYENIISNDTIYCGNRLTKKFKEKGISYNILGYSNNNTGYKIYYELLNNKNISLNCNNINDMYSLNNGNKKLSNSIGLVSAEELYYAGFTNKNSYLNTTYDYWTMTPAYYNGNGAYNIIASKGNLIPSLVSKEYGIRPVITIKSNIKVLSGNGNISAPYMLDIE